MKDNASSPKISQKQKLKKQIENTFLQLITIDEIFQQEDKIISYCKKFLRSLDISIKSDSYNNLIAYIPGTGETILLNTHLDTPENVPNLGYTKKNNIIASNGKGILGADPKSGLAVLLHVARTIKKGHLLTRPIEFVFTRGEEAGLQGAIKLDYSLLRAKTGLVIDEDGNCTQVVTQAPGYYRLDISIEGKVVHPRDWEQGVNALDIAAKVLSLLPNGEIVKGVTFNVGILKAGTARNTTAGNATLAAELRSFDTQKLVKYGKKVEHAFQIASQKAGASCKISSGLEFAGFKLTKNSPLFVHLEKTYKHFSLKPHYYSTYGGSDANIFNQKGIITVPIGSGYMNAHQYTEYVDLQSMLQLHDFIIQFARI